MQPPAVLQKIADTDLQQFPGKGLGDISVGSRSIAFNTLRLLRTGGKKKYRDMCGKRLVLDTTA